MGKDRKLFDANHFIYVVFSLENASKNAAFGSLEMALSRKAPFDVICSEFNSLPKHLVKVRRARVLGDRLGFGGAHDTIYVTITNPWHAKVVKNFLSKMPQDIQISVWKGEQGPFEASPKQVAKVIEGSLLNKYYSVVRDLSNGDVLFLWIRPGKRYGKLESFLYRKLETRKYSELREKVDELFKSRGVDLILLEEDLHCARSKKRWVRIKLAFLKCPLLENGAQMRFDWEAYRKALLTFFDFVNREFGSFGSPLVEAPAIYVPLLPFDGKFSREEKKKLFLYIAQTAQIALKRELGRYIRFFDNKNLYFLSDILDNTPIQTTKCDQKSSFQPRSLVVSLREEDTKGPFRLEELEERVGKVLEENKQSLKKDSEFEKFLTSERENNNQEVTDKACSAKTDDEEEIEESVYEELEL